eukprot:PhF_6_TR6871/c0_g1_i1/m.9890
MTDSCEIQWRKCVPSTPPPPPRSFHTCVLHDSQLWIYGGRNASIVMNDLHSFDTRTGEWVERPCGMLHRAYHVAVLDAARNRMIVHGGKNLTPNYFDDMSAFDFTTMSWTLHIPQANNPGPRGYHTAGMIGTDDMVCLGGHNSFMWYDVASIFNFVTESWRHLSLGYVPPSIRHKKMVCPKCVQGTTKCPKCNAGTCVHLSRTMQAHRTSFASSSGLRTEPSTSAITLPPRDGHTMITLDGINYVFGGELSKSFYDAVFATDTRSRTWTTMSGYGEHRVDEDNVLFHCKTHQGPGHRGYHTAWAHEDQKLVVVWGGYQHVGLFFNDMNCFDVMSGEWYSVNQKGDVPTPRASCCATTNPLNPNQVWMYGGDDGNDYFCDVYEGQMSIEHSLKHLVRLCLTNNRKACAVPEVTTSK